PSINNFFVGDDFTWLHWAASANIHDIPQYFVNAQGFFYRPLAKTLMFFFYTLFSFQPAGYHLIILLLHFLVTVGVYLFTRRILGGKIWPFFAAFIFLLLPAHTENLFWIST